MNTIITKTQQQAAKIAGLSYLASVVIVVYVNFAIHDRLITSDNPAETAQKILVNEQLFRLGIVGDLFYCVLIVALAAALYVILRAVNHTLALLGAFWRLIWVLMWLTMTLHLFDALRLIHGDYGLKVIEPEKLNALASLDLGTRFDYYYVGLLFGSLASTLCSYLWLRSRYVPRWLAVFGLISSAWCVLCTVIFYIFPHFDDIVNLWWFDTPMAIFDLVISFWLVIAGLRQPLP